MAVLVVGGVVGAPPDAGLSGAPSCAQLLKDARAALAKGDDAAAGRAIDDALKRGEDPPEGGDCVSSAHRLQGDLAMKSDAHKRAALAYRNAAHHAGEDEKLWRTLTTLRLEALKKAGSKPAEDSLRRLLDQEAAIRRYARAAQVAKAALGSAEREIEAAQAALRADKDAIRAAYAGAVKAKVLAWSGESDRALQLAAQWFAPERPPFVREIALEAAVRVAQAKGDLEGEVRFALQLNAVRARNLPPAERRYFRTPALDRICSRWEAKVGAGRCATVAKQLTGEYSFRDWSKLPPKPTLSVQDLELAQAQYLPAIKGCVEDAVKANQETTLFENASINISFTITSLGTTREVEISPRRYDTHLGGCVRERVASFRYPRARDGGVRTVSIPYQLDLVEHFGWGSK